MMRWANVAGAVAFCLSACATRVADQGMGQDSVSWGDSSFKKEKKDQKEKKDKDQGTGGSGTCDPAMIQTAETNALTLVHPEGCTDVSQCKAAAVGSQACGGPRYYTVYCSATTNSQQLLRELDQLARQEDQYNRQCNIASICIFVGEPQLTLVDGVCQAYVPSTTLP